MRLEGFCKRRSAEGAGRLFFLVLNGMKAIELEEITRVELYPRPPFSFDPSVHKPDHFPSQDTVWEPGVRWQTMVWEGKCLGLKFVNRGSVDDPRIELEIYYQGLKGPTFPIGVEEGWTLLDEINYRYGFQEDFSEFNEKFKDDPQLGPIIKKWPGMRVMSPQSLYEYLVIGIVLQNCTVKRSVNMMQVLFENYGTKVRFDGREFYCFWEPKDLNRVSEDDLRALKIGYRAKSIKRLSTWFADKKVKQFELLYSKSKTFVKTSSASGVPSWELELRKKSKEEQRGALLDLYGIGPATVGYILFDVFKHYDELNHISPWEQKIYSKLFFDRDPDNLVSEGELLNFFEERFGKYKMLAVHYIWEDLWWQRKNQPVPWLEELIRL